MVPPVTLRLVVACGIWLRPPTRRALLGSARCPRSLERSRILLREALAAQGSGLSDVGVSTC
jgi:hypothetical protein